MSQPYLFYSDRCQNSQQIIQTLKALNKGGLYKFVQVETLPRNQIPSFLQKVPTLYVPDTKEVIVGKDIYGYIAKPTNSRKEIPQKEGAVTASGSSAPSQGPIGDLSPWGFEGGGRLTESYSMWSSPGSFVQEGGSMYTFLEGGSPSLSNSAGLSSGAAPASENTLGSKTGTNDDVKRRMESMQKQRETEFSGIARK